MKLTGLRLDVEAVRHMPARGIYIKLDRYLSEGNNLVEVVFQSSGPLDNGTRLIKYDSNTLAGTYWSKQFSLTNQPIARWWQCDYIVRAINERVCGRRLSGVSNGLYAQLKRDFSHKLPAKRAVSVGSGCGVGEIEAIEAGMFESFDCFEVSQEAVDRGRLLAQERGLADQVHFHMTNPFIEVCNSNIYDAVYWRLALHHMPDTRAALWWSRQVLKPGGLFVMDEYVGATRMQFPQEMIKIATEFRMSLHEPYLVDPNDPQRMLDVVCVSPDEDDLIAMDPSECRDSDNILPALYEYFPNVKVQLPGGGVYHLGLSDVLHNIVLAEDYDALDRAMDMDDQCTALGNTQYTVAYGT